MRRRWRRRRKRRGEVYPGRWAGRAEGGGLLHAPRGAKYHFFGEESRPHRVLLVPCLHC